MKNRSPKPVKPLIKDIKAALKTISQKLDLQLPETKTGSLQTYSMGWLDGYTTVERNAAVKMDAQSLLIQVCSQFGFDDYGLALYQRNLREPLKNEEQLNQAIEASKNMYSYHATQSESEVEFPVLEITSDDISEPIVTETSTKSKAPKKVESEPSDWFPEMYNGLYKVIVPDPFLSECEHLERMGVVRKSVNLYVKINKRYKEVANHPMNDDETDAGIAWSNENSTEIDFLVNWKKTRTDNPLIKEFDNSHGGEWSESEYRAMMSPLVQKLERDNANTIPRSV